MIRLVPSIVYLFSACSALYLSAQALLPAAGNPIIITNSASASEAGPTVAEGGGGVVMKLLLVKQGRQWLMGGGW